MTDGVAPGYGPWRDPGRSARWAIGGLTVAIGVLTVDTLWTAVGIAAVGGLFEAPPDAWFDAYDRITNGIWLLYLATLVPSAVMFIRWQQTTVRNLLFLGRERLEYSPVIVAAAWFIPFISLVLPYIVVVGVARDSRPPEASSAGELVGWWWGLWLTANFVLTASTILFTVSESANGWIAAAAVDAVGSLTLIGAGILALRIVSVVSAHQRRLAAVRAA